MSDDDLIQKGQDDLIRRGDALKALDWRDIYGRNAQDAINTVPAVQPTVSPKQLAAQPDDVAALVEAVDAAFACGMIPKSSASEGGANQYSEQVRVADQLRAALARVKGETK